MSATFYPPDADQTWTLDEQIVFLQQLAVRLYDASNWMGAYRALSRIITLSRRRPDEPRPAPAHASPPAPPPTHPTPEEAYAALLASLAEVNEGRAKAGLALISRAEMLDWYATQFGEELAGQLRAVDASLHPPPSG